MRGDYIPSQDATLHDWADNFASLISATPAAYGLGGPDATTIQGAVDAFDAAYAIAVNPPTRTGPSVAAKDAAKASMLATVRPYAQAIRNDLGVSNELKLGLGVTVPDPSKSPIPAPSTNPLLSIIAATPGAHTLRFADSNTPDKRSKPFGAIGLEVWRVIATGPAMSPSDATFMGLITRQPFASAFTADQNGKTCTYFARWITRTGLFGPWSPPVSMTIAA